MVQKIGLDKFAKPFLTLIRISFGTLSRRLSSSKTLRRFLWDRFWIFRFPWRLWQQRRWKAHSRFPRTKFCFRVIFYCGCRFRFPRRLNGLRILLVFMTGSIFPWETQISIFCFLSLKLWSGFSSLLSHHKLVYFQIICYLWHLDWYGDLLDCRFWVFRKKCICRLKKVRCRLLIVGRNPDNNTKPFTHGSLVLTVTFFLKRVSWG